MMSTPGTADPGTRRTGRPRGAALPRAQRGHVRTEDAPRHRRHRRPEDDRRASTRRRDRTDAPPRRPPRPRADGSRPRPRGHGRVAAGPGMGTRRRSVHGRSWPPSRRDPPGRSCPRPPDGAVVERPARSRGRVDPARTELRLVVATGLADTSDPAVPWTSGVQLRRWNPLGADPERPCNPVFEWQADTVTWRTAERTRQLLSAVAGAGLEDLARRRRADGSCPTPA